MKRIFIYLLVAIAVTSCKSLSKQKKIEQNAAQVLRNQEMTELQEAQRNFDEKKFENALEAFRNFQTAHNHSEYYMVARIGEARSLESLEQWTEALVAYKDIQRLTLTEQPEISVQALYRLSFCYEALGDDTQALAVTLDSLRKGDYLPPQVAKAEIPARIAMFYEKVQNSQEAEKYIALAQKGIEELQGQSDISPEVFAKTYFQMGAVSTNQISAENYSQIVKGQSAVQIYSLKSMNLNIAPWSERAAADLQTNYNQLWLTLSELPGVSGVDDESIERSKKALQISYGGELVDLIQRAELSIPALKQNNLEKEFLIFIRQIKKKTQSLIYRSEEFMRLTKESEKLNSLKRPGRIRSDVPFLPAKKTQPPLVPSEDPNL